ncbi:MAG: Asp-tRNA(Asn)/Glu-tRNA(Gln) amidotransferase subunit GatA [Alphaproteobacteria bacterium]|nr:Asp-tRNA(Asn)/Glu-tRNA(Gln) amidotransferase subunit GatA [Alphaproteobacteria bacterium]
MTKLTDLNIVEAVAARKKNEFSCVDMVKEYIAAMDKFRGLNCYITETPDLAIKQAEESDKKYAAGTAGALEGMPLAQKDMFCTKGVRTTAASNILNNFIPTYESTVSDQMNKQGAVLLGKTNQDEFAMGASNTTSFFGNVINPWKASGARSNQQLVPGGSSGGSAAAVAAHLCIAATGTDTNGSSRQPASFCGVVGMKPTYGRASRWGIVAFASSLDQAGIFSRTVTDSALLMEHMCGFDPKDSTSANLPVPKWSQEVSGSLKGKVIGVPKEFRIDGMPQEIEDIWEKGAQWLRDAGAEVVEISLPHAKYAVPAYYIIAPAEASSNLARYDGVRYGLHVDGKDLNESYKMSRAQGFGAEPTRRIMIGTYALSAGYYDAYYLKAQKVRRKVANDHVEAFKKVDAILTPTAPSSAFAIGEKSDDPVQMYLCDIFTSPASLAGLPGISIPVGLDKENLPLGLQVIGKPWDETTMFQVAWALEQAANFKALPQEVA